MDVYDDILSRNNTILTSNVFSTIVQLIQNKLSSGSSAPKKDIVELKYLKEKVMCADPLICSTASNGLIYLVKCGALQPTNTMAELVAMIPLAGNNRGIIMAIVELLIVDLNAKAESKSYSCPFNLVTPQHPLISILVQDSNAWTDILSYIIKSYENNERVYLNELFRPLFLYILCDPFLKTPQLCRIKFSHFILEKCDVHFVTDIVAWLQITSNENELHTVTFLLNLVESSYLKCDYDLQEFLLLWLTSALYELCVKKWNPTEIMLCMSKLVDEVKFRSTSAVLSILTNCFHTISSVDLKDLLKLCKKIILKNVSNLHVLQSVKAALLNWMLHPSILVEDCLQIINDLFTYIESNEESNSSSKLLRRNKYICLYQSTNEHVHLAIELSILLESWTNSEKIYLWLNSLEHVPPLFFRSLFSTLSGVFLYECDVSVSLKALALLVTYSQINKHSAGNTLTLMLYKLANTTNRQIQFNVLKALPKMGVVKENLHVIIGTLQALYKSSPQMKSFTMSLHYDLWECEVKCYPYLQNLIMEDSRDVNFNITKAHVLKNLCAKRPELYGTELAGHLSKILNLNKKDDASALTSALALEGLKHLCTAGLIDIDTAWSTLTHRFSSESRTMIIKSFCDLLSEVPNLHTESAKYEKMVSEVVNTLWNYIITSSEQEVICAACKALGNFSLEQISNQFPDIYQEAQIPNEQCLLNLKLISGKCWIRVLQNINYNALSSVADLLITLISKEVCEYTRGIYVVPRNTGEPVNYNYLPEHSIVRALINYIKKQVHKCNTEIDVVYLRIISHEYSKPLPPLDWCFLQELVHVPQFRNYCICLASHQVVLSGTARRFMENFLRALVENSNDVNDIICVIENLKHLCNSIQPMIIKPFIETAYQSAKKMVEDDENYLLLDKMILHINEMLKKPDVHEANKNVLIQIIVGNLRQEAVTNDIFKKLLNCVVMLPQKSIKELSSKQWCETSSDNFKKALMIRSILAKENTNLIWFNDIIDVTGFLKDFSDQNYVLQVIFDVLISIEDNKIASNWILELLGQIQVNLADQNAFNRKIKFMCDVLIMSIVTLSGYHSVLEDGIHDGDELLIFFPQSLTILMKREHWNDSVSQVLEWLYHMRNFENIPEQYRNSFFKALMALKHESVFKESLKWMKYIGCKLPIK